MKDHLMSAMCVVVGVAMMVWIAPHGFQLGVREGWPHEIAAAYGVTIFAIGVTFALLAAAIQWRVRR